jgi:preprotein translocase subunit SecA
LVEDEIEQVVLFHTGEIMEAPDAPGGVKAANPGDWDVKEIAETVNTIVPLNDEHQKQLKQLTIEAQSNKLKIAEERTKIIEAIMDIIRDAYVNLEDLFENRKDLHNIERAVMLRAIDTLWIDHLAAMTALRTGIGLRGYGQRDPLVEYKKEAYDMFQGLLGKIDQEIVYGFFKSAKHAVDVKVQAELVNRSLLQRAGVKLMGAAKTQGGSTSSTQKATEKVGRNEPCPCGSGKKYKKCCGA